VYLLKRLSMRLLRNLARDVWRVHTQPVPRMLPVVMTHFVTYRCNFRCSFCNVLCGGLAPPSRQELGTEDCVRLLAILREAVPHLHLTGGEPLMRSDIVEIASAARALGFRSIGLASNLSLLDEREAVLDQVSDVFASLHAFDEASYAAGRSPRLVSRALENLTACARLQKEKGFRLTADLVLNPTSLPRLEQILAFCFERGIGVMVVPELRSDGSVDPRLRDDPAWPRAIEKLLALRRSGAPVLDGEYYLQTIRGFEPFRCYPEMTPATSPSGELFTPCRILASNGPDVLAAGSWREASRLAGAAGAPLPACRARCHAGCAIVPSGAVERPMEMLRGVLGKRPREPAPG
jgi:MoaA/NifB/PqqE/SkfB family radical SAM enzyme